MRRRVRDRTVGALVACLAAGVCASCLEGGGGRGRWDRCDAAHGCTPGFECLYGRCRPPCTFDRDCPEGSVCVAAGADPAARVCTAPDELGCGEERACPPGLVCDPSTGACRNECEVGGGCGPGRLCRDGVCLDADRCGDGLRCRLGCVCLDGVCRPADGVEQEGYCTFGPSPTEIGPEHGDRLLVVDTAEDEAGCAPPAVSLASCREDGALSLREALLVAAADDGPHRIVFDGRLAGATLELGAELPPLTSLTWLDGGDGVVLWGEGIGAAGVVLDGVGLVLSGLEVAGFGGAGVRVAAGARDVHLFRTRVGARGRGNGAGIVVEEGCEDLWIARGRELEAVAPVEVAVPAAYTGTNLETASYDANVVVGNRGHGISATRVRGLRVSGTWVGFDPRTGTEPNDGDVNDGTGLHLEEVSNAVVGPLLETPAEVAGLRSYLAWPSPGAPTLRGADPFAGFVIVGQSGAGGVLVRGGSGIALSGLYVGDSPNWVPYRQNAAYGVRIEGNRGPVTVGPPARARGSPAAPFVFVFTRTVAALEVVDNEAEVLVRRLHVVQLGGPLDSVVRVQGPRAPVRLAHVTVNARSSLGRGVVAFEGLGEEGRLEVTRSLFLLEGEADVVQRGTDSASPVLVENNLGHRVRAACSRSCDEGVGNDLSREAPPWTLDDARAWVIPLVPDLPFVDAALPFEPEPGVLLDLNGAEEGTFSGCGPDIGAFECVTDACHAAPCG